MKQDLTLRPSLQMPQLLNSPWVICLTAGLFFFYDFIQLNMFNTLNPYIAKTFTLDAVQIGNMSATFLYANVLMLPFSGALLDRYSIRTVILSAMLICTFSTLLFAIAPNFWVASLARFICGGSTAFCFLSCIVLATRWFPAKNLAQVTGVIVTMAMAGGAISQAPMAYLIDLYGWRNALLFDSLLGMFFFAIIYQIIKDYPKGHKKIEPVSEPVLASYKRAFSNPQNLICGLYTSLMNLFIIVFGAAWGSEYLNHVYQFDNHTSSKISMMLFLGTIIGSPLAGYISDKLKRRRAPMIIGAILSFALSILLLLRPELSIFQLRLIFFTLGLTTSTQIISYPVIFETNPPAITGTCEALAGVLIMSGGAVFQPVFGWLMNQHWSGIIQNGMPIYSGGDYHFAYLIFPITLLISLILATRIKETHCQPIWLKDTQNISSQESP